MGCGLRRNFVWLALRVRGALNARPLRAHHLHTGWQSLKKSWSHQLFSGWPSSFQRTPVCLFGRSWPMSGAPLLSFAFPGAVVNTGQVLELAVVWHHWLILTVYEDTWSTSFFVAVDYKLGGVGVFPTWLLCLILQVYLAKWRMPPLPLFQTPLGYLLKPFNNPLRYLALLFLWYGWGNQNLERLSRSPNFKYHKW